MNIAELFVNLGITGTEKTSNALQGVKKGLQETGSMALETKAALVAILYATERLFSASNRVGTGLQNFNSLVGVSTDTLQEYQYAAQQVGVSNDQVASTFKNLQGTMTNILLNKGVPEGLARVALKVGDFSPKDIEEYSKAPQKLLMKLQEYAQKETNIPLRNTILKQFGIGDEMAAALSRNAFRPDIMAKAPKYSPREIGQLDKNNAAWANLGQQIQMAFGHFNAKHGAEIIKGISDVTTAVFQLAEALTVLGEKLQVFDWLKDMLGALTFITQAATDINDIAHGADPADPKRMKKVDKRTEDFRKEHGVTSFISDLLFGGDKDKQRMEMATSILDKAKGDYAARAQQNKGLPPALQTAGPPTALLPSMPVLPSAPGLSPMNTPVEAPVQQTITVNQNNTFHGANAKEVQKANTKMRNEVRDAFRQMSSQGQGG